MARYGKISHPKTDFKGLKFRFLSEKKFGKTGWIETIDVKFRKAIEDFTVLILEIGAERGTDAIYCNSQHIDSFKTFIKVIDDIVANPDDYPPMIAIDTENELSRLAEEYAIKQYNSEREVGKKKAKTINGAFGGHHNGQFYTRDAIKDQLGRITGAGKGRITIGHTKRKEIVDKTAEDGAVKYEQVTSNLMSTYDSAYAESADIIMIGYYRYEEFEDKNENESMRKERVVSFTSRESVSIGSGSRFLGIQESIDLKTYEDGATASDQYKVNIENGDRIISVIQVALRDNAKARGLEVTDSLTHLDNKPDVKKTKKPKPKPSTKSSTLLSKQALWDVCIVAGKSEHGKEIKKKIVNICKVSQGKLVKLYIVDDNATKDQLRKINELVKEFI